MTDSKLCPKCDTPSKGYEVVPGIVHWECKKCGMGSEVYYYSGCKIWMVKKYTNGRPVVIECKGCCSFIST